MQPYSYQFKAMGCGNVLLFYSESEESAIAVSRRLIEEVMRIEKKYSRYDENSLISRINTAAGTHERIEVDEETAALFNFAESSFQQSDGLFDITSGVLRTIWSFKNPRIPSSLEINKALSLVGWQFVEWKRPHIRLPRSGMQIDFGGIGKEYAADAVAALALSLDVQFGYVNLGGDIRAFGPRIDGSAWMIGLTHPRNQQSVMATIALSDGAIATSGDYERFFEIEGQRYCHILNPKTVMPVTDLQSVSVISNSCLVAGTAATIGMLLGSDQIDSFLNRQGLHYMIVDSRGEVRNSLVNI